MVGHQAIGQYVDFVVLAVLLQPFQVNLPVFIGEKDIFSTVAALCDVVGDSGEYGSCLSWHWGNVAQRRLKG